MNILLKTQMPKGLAPQQLYHSIARSQIESRTIFCLCFLRRLFQKHFPNILCLNFLPRIFTSSLHLFILVPTVSFSLNNTFPPCASPCYVFRLLPFSTFFPASISPCWERKKAKHQTTSTPTSPPVPALASEELLPALRTGAKLSFGMGPCRRHQPITGRNPELSPLLHRYALKLSP